MTDFKYKYEDILIILDRIDTSFNEIIKQLFRIANSLDKKETKCPYCDVVFLKGGIKDDKDDNA